MPSGGRHCRRTSCSRETSFPRGSWSNVFFRSGERDREREREGEREREKMHKYINPRSDTFTVQRVASEVF